MSLPLPVKVLQRMVRERVDFVLIGVSAINHYAPDSSAAYFTQDCDVLIRPDAAHLGKAIRILRRQKYALRVGGEPLVKPDALMIRRLIEHRAVVQAVKPNSSSIDLVMEAKGFSFPQWRRRRRIFTVGGVKIPVGSLAMLLRSKELSGREKDRVFLKLYQSQVRDWIRPYRAQLRSSSAPTSRRSFAPAP